MNPLAKRLHAIAERYGTGPREIARFPEPYEAALAKIGLDAADLTRDLIQSAEIFDRTWWRQIETRVERINATINFRKRQRESEDFDLQSERRPGSIPAKRNETPTTRTQNMVKVERSAVVALFQALGLSNAPTWSEQRMQDKIAKLPEIVADEEAPVLKGATKKLCDKLLEAVEDDVEIDVLADDADDEPTPAKGGKKKAAAAPADDEDDDDDSDDGDEDDETDDSDDDADDDDSDEDEDDEDEEPAPKKGGKPAKAAAPAGDDDDDEIVVQTPGLDSLVAVLQHMQGIRAILERIAVAIESLVGGDDKPAAPKKRGGRPVPTPEPADEDDDSDDEDDGKPAAPAKGGSKLSDVIAEIKKIMVAANSEKKALTKTAIVEKLAKRFPDRDAAWLKEKLNVQLPGRLTNRDKLTVKKTSDGKFWVKPS